MGALVEVSTVERIMGAREFPSLVAEYAAEAATEGMPPPDARMEAYLQLEAVGLLHVFGATVGPALVGFISLLAAPLPHFGLPVAVSESFFVGAAHRSTGAGLKLLKAAEGKAREMGSPGLLVSAPFAGRLFELLPRQGYAEVSRTFFKRMHDA